MSVSNVYQQVYNLLDEHLDDLVEKPARKRIALLVLGIIGAKSASPARVAKAVSELGLCGAKPESIERRVRRIENDEQLTAVLCIHPFVRERLVIGKPDHLLLIVDPTTQEDRVVMVAIAAWYRGRALPLVWTLWPANQPLKGDGFWQRIETLFDTLAPLLPTGIEVTVAADRAFGTPMFTDIIASHGWHFLVRVQGQTRCCDNLGRQQRVDQLVKIRGNRAKLRGRAFKKHRWRDVSVVVYWGGRHKTPLCLVSSLPPKWQLVLLYRRRFPIEAMFRDYKSYGWQWEAGQVTDIDHIERLLVGMALATWVVLYAGTQVAELQLRKPPTGRRRTVPWVGKRSLFQLGLSWIHRCFHHNSDCWSHWQFRHWSGPNWSQQIRAHHAKAYVFATR